MKSKVQYTKTEFTLIIFALTTFFAASFLYVSGNNIQSFFWGIQDDSLKQIGYLSQKNGVIQRELNEESDFKALNVNSRLYNYDTVVTDDKSSATITLDDGSSIFLEPNTMIRLIQENSFKTPGSYRSYNINVFNGNVSAKSVKTKFSLQSKTNEKIFVKNGEFKKLSITPSAPTVKYIAQESTHTEKYRNLSQYIPETYSSPPAKPVVVIPQTPDQPKHIAKIQHYGLPNPAKEKSSQIQNHNSNSNVNNNFQPKGLNQQVHAQQRTVMTTVPPSPSPTPKVVANNYPAPVTSTIAISKDNPFAVYPPNNMNLSVRSLTNDGIRKSIILTWAQQPQVLFYEIEISTDPNFKNIFLRKRVTQNVFLFSTYQVQQYWWRIRSYGEQSISTYSPVNTFTVSL